MRRGFTLLEMVVVLAVVALLTTIVVTRLVPLLDWIAADGAARDMTTALAVTRTAAVLRGARARLRIAADSLRIDREGAAGWEPYARWPGPASTGVSLTVSNPEVVFSPLGIAWGLGNTRIVLRRGSQVETITTSRLGRVRRF
ncbi:MAG TPA: GspH/FimT family pseudopilin [Gemmatimonadales bacterium]|nr:GspH/FimT family pseudopilin [Gemmatimonadales bacterium]